MAKQLLPGLFHLRHGRVSCFFPPTNNSICESTLLFDVTVPGFFPLQLTCRRMLSYSEWCHD